MSACIFDLDGVLVDTARYHFQAWLAVAEKYGLDFDSTLNEALKGVSRQRSFEIIVAHNRQRIEDYNVADILTEKNRLYLQFIASINATELLPGTIELLTACKEKGIYICLGSASKNAKHILAQTGILHYFDIIVDGNDVTRAKPDPEVFIKSSQQLGINNEECTVFEDSVAGIQAAKTANMKTVGIGDKHILTLADITIPDLRHFNLQMLHN